MFPIALQLYSVREDLENDFAGTIRKVKELGYEGVEFAGLYGQSPADVKKLLDEVGLIPVSAHVPYVEMIADPEKVLKDYKEIGCQYVAIPYITEEYRQDGDKYEEFIAGTKLLGETANKLGLVLLYHNHDFEFEKFDGKYTLDTIYERVSADLLQTEIDTCWVNVAGENPSDYIRKYTGRSPVVHLKDFKMPTKKPAKLYELIGLEDEKEAEDDVFELRPLGTGEQDFPAILKASEEAGAKWVVVEQDRPSMKKTPLECAQVSIEYLKSL